MLSFNYGGKKSKKRICVLNCIEYIGKVGTTVNSRATDMAGERRGRKLFSFLSSVETFVSFQCTCITYSRKYFKFKREPCEQTDLQTVIQSVVSQKEKNKYRTLMHICGI